jgi:hypothetical protein
MFAEGMGSTWEIGEPEAVCYCHVDCIHPHESGGLGMEHLDGGQCTGSRKAATAGRAHR